MAFSFVVKRTPVAPPEPEVSEFGVYLAEYKHAAGGTPAYDFAWVETTDPYLKVGSTGSSYGYYDAFISMPKTRLDGNNLAIQWQQYGSVAAWPEFIEIWDGRYDPLSTTDFPEDTPANRDDRLGSKGAGKIYSWEGQAGSKNWNTSGILNLSSSVLDDVTIFIGFTDNHALDDGGIYIFDIEIRDSGDQVLYSMVEGGIVTMSNVSAWDKGDYSNGAIGPEVFYG